MKPFVHFLRTNSRRLFGTATCVLALTLFGTTAAASDTVEKLREVLKTGSIEPTQQEIIAQKQKIRTVVQQLRYIGDIRQAYFLKDWNNPTDAAEIRAEFENIKKEVGEMLYKRIFAAAQGEELQQLAAAMHVVEIAENDVPIERKPAGKFAAAFAPILIGKNGLVKNPSITVRQAAIHALGKITPSPDAALDSLDDVLRNDQLGPRRLAAYALYDLVKNAHYLNREQELRTLERSILAAGFGLTDADDQVRGHCLEAIKLAAERNIDYPWLIDPMQLTVIDGKVIPAKAFVKVVEAYAKATPKLLQSLSDPNPNIKLTAMMALEKISLARARVISRIADKTAEVNPAQNLTRAQVLKKNGIPDSLGNMVEKGWLTVAHLLQRGPDAESSGVRQRAAQLLEVLAEEIDLTSAELHKNNARERRRFADAVTAGLLDTDRFVRLTSTRMLRAIEPSLIDRESVIAIGYILVDHKQNDADLSDAAAKTLESIAKNKDGSRVASAAAPFLQAVLIDPKKDDETRTGAIKALIAIGGSESRKAIPQIIQVLGSSDVRVRRIAAEALGRLGRSDDAQVVEGALRALRAALRDDDAEVRLNSTEAILSISQKKGL